MKFVWDRNKEVRNVQKHGISFQRACEVFLDPGLVTEPAADDGGGEIWAAIGYLEWEPQLMYVVHLDMRGELIRIISARAVTRRERIRYEE